MENPIWFALLQDSSLFQRANISYIILMLLRRAGWICEESCMTLNQMGNPGNHIFPGRLHACAHARMRAGAQARIPLRCVCCGVYVCRAGWLDM